jgi:MFS family permease
VSTTGSPAAALQPTPQAAGRLYRRNYIAYSIEGITFGVGAAFLDVGTLLPTIVQSLGGPLWLVSLVPMLGQVASAPASVLSLPIVERLRRYSPYVQAMMLLQRGPYLLAGLALLMASSNPMLAVLAVAMAPILSGIGGGLCGNGWVNLMMVTVPPQRRSSLLAIRMAGSALGGAGVSALAGWILLVNPGPGGYATLHLLCFGCMAISTLSFLLVRDPPHVPTHHTGELMDSWRRMFSSILHDGTFRTYVASRFFGCGVYMLMAFLAIHARAVLGEDESYVARLLLFQVLGSLGGNLLAGFIGDRVGGKATTTIGTFVFLAAAALAAVASSHAAFGVLFVLTGFAMPTMLVGAFAMGTEMCPPGRRAAYWAMMSISSTPAMLLASWASSTMWQWKVGIWPLAAAAATTQIISLLLLLRVPDPRRWARAAAASDGTAA